MNPETLQSINMIEPQKALPTLVLKSLRETGYVVVKNFLSESDTLPTAKEKLLRIVEMVGQPISHDGNGSIIWDIKSRPSNSSGVVTYSEHQHEAQLHTDSQYSQYTEHCFSLVTIKKADCGGGMSFLLSLEDILNELRSSQKNDNIERILRETKYPFIVPNVFKKQGENPEYNFGSILGDNEIRFRVDTLEKALALNSDFCTPEQVDAYKTLKDIILNTAKTQAFFLEDRDAIFINNRTMLHGRSSFKDPNRHMLRVRFNFKPNIAL